MAFSIPNFKLYHRAQRSNVSALARQLFCKRSTYSINVAAIICNLYGASSVRRCITAPAWTIFASLVVVGSLVLICTRCPIRSGYNIYTLPYRSTSSQIKTLWETCSTENIENSHYNYSKFIFSVNQITWICLIKSHITITNLLECFFYHNTIFTNK